MQLSENLLQRMKDMCNKRDERDYTLLIKYTKVGKI